MGVLIDTSVLIAQERHDVDLSAYIAHRSEEDCFLSVITASELLHGVHRARDDAQRSRRSAYVEAVLRALPLLPIDVSIARAHAQLWASLVTAGTPIGPHDMWIAATCIAHGLTLATFNVREFRRAPGLDMEVWSG